MTKLETIYQDKKFLHGNNPYNLDYERTARYAEVHSMQTNPILFGISDTGVKVRAPFIECDVVKQETVSPKAPSKPPKKPNKK